jgi:PAS domain S-box-containing protein
MLARADYNGAIVAANPAWSKLLGWSEHEVLTKPYASIISPDDLGRTLAALQAMRETRPADTI